jgi:TPR repeat protein
MIRPHVRNEVPEALYFLAKQYIEGIGVAPNPKRAVKIYKAAVKLGNVSSMTMLATCYAHGVGIKQNARKAMRLYRMAADRPRCDAEAQTMLGQMLWKAKNYYEAGGYFGAAAWQGHTEAQYLYGANYFRMPVNTDERLFAVLMLARAAAKGHKKAIDTLALLDREEVEAASEAALDEAVRARGSERLSEMSGGRDPPPTQQSTAGPF